MATSRSQFGITWNFAQDYTVGQFANGDHWVLVDAATNNQVWINSITPASTLTGSSPSGTIGNGSMIDPVPGAGTTPPHHRRQGFLCYQSFGGGNPVGGDVPYDHNLNVAFGISAGSPLKIDGDSSLVSYICPSAEFVADPGFSFASTAAVLTVVSSVPATGTFRPWYSGASNGSLAKDYGFNTSNIDWSILNDNVVPLTTHPVSGKPAIGLSLVERHVERPWIDFIAGWTGTSIHPHLNMAGYLASDRGYARGMAQEMSDCALMLLASDHTQVAKETLMYGTLQVGIDQWGVVANRVAGGDPSSYTPFGSGDGGHPHGRKWPILFMAMAFGRQDIINTLSSTTKHHEPPTFGHAFGEDMQTFYVEETAPGEYNYNCAGAQAPADKYLISDVGIAEWGWNHADPALGLFYDSCNGPFNQAGELKGLFSGKNSEYRFSSTMNAQGGMILGAMLIRQPGKNMRQNWNHEPLFDYYDRYHQDLIPARGGPIWFAAWENRRDNFTGNYDRHWQLTMRNEHRGSIPDPGDPPANRTLTVPAVKAKSVVKAPPISGSLVRLVDAVSAGTGVAQPARLPVDLPDPDPQPPTTSQRVVITAPGTC